MLKNEYNILFDQFVPLDIPGPVFDALKQLYSNYTDRIDKLPKHIVNIFIINIVVKLNLNFICKELFFKIVQFIITYS